VEESTPPDMATAMVCSGIKIKTAAVDAQQPLDRL
jgi:hypothetical protein